MPMVKHKTHFADFPMPWHLLCWKGWLHPADFEARQSPLPTHPVLPTNFGSPVNRGMVRWCLVANASICNHTHQHINNEKLMEHYEILLNDLAFLVNLFKGIGHLIIVALSKIEGIASQYTADLQLRGTHFLWKNHGIPIATSAVSCCTHSCFHEPFFEQVWFLERFLDKPKGIMLEKWFTVYNMSHVSYRFSCAIPSKWCFCNARKLQTCIHLYTYNCTTDVRLNVLNKLFQDKRPFRANTSTGSLGALFGAMVWPRLRTTGALAWDLSHSV